MPPLCLSTQVFTIDSPLADGYDNNSDGKTDSSRSTANAAAMAAWNGELLIHGRINANTAPRAVLMSMGGVGQLVAASNRGAIADQIISYRNNSSVGGILGSRVRP